MDIGFLTEWPLISRVPQMNFKRTIQARFFPTYFVILLITTFWCVAAGANEHRSALSSWPVSFDPVSASDTVGQFVLNNSHEGLLNWTPEAGLAPGLAESWTKVKGDARYRFKLRPNLFFANGAKLSEKDVVLHFDRLRRQPGYFRSHFVNLSRIRAIGRGQIEISLVREDPNFLLLVASVAGRVVKRFGRNWVGAGPFAIEFTKNELTLRPNVHYWGQRPEIERVRFKMMSESEALRAARAGAIDDMLLYSPTPDSLGLLRNEMKLHRIWATWVIGFDQRVSPLDQVELRRRLVGRISSKDWISKFYPEQTEAFGLIPIGMPGAVDSATDNKFTSVDEKFPELVITIPDSLGRATEIARYIEGRMPGVRTQLKPFDWMMANYANGRMGAFLVSINAEYPDVSFIVRALKSNSDGNFLGIKNDQLDKLIEHALSDSDAKMRSEYFAKVNRFLSENAATVNLMHVRQVIWMRSCVSGVKLSPVSEGHHDIRRLVNRCKNEN